MVRKRDIKLIDDVVRTLKLSKEQRNLLHQAIHGQEFSRKDILEIAREIKRDYPKS
jgi:hypothetical protein